MTNIHFQPPPGIRFEIRLESDGHLHISSLVPGDEQAAQAVVNALVQTQPFADAWDSSYRTAYLLSGAATEPVSTLEQVRAIPVPHWRRLRGDLTGDQLRLDSLEVSDDGEQWRPVPEFSDLNEENRHPAFVLPGEPIGRFVTLQWREGRIDIEPDPPEDLLELTEHVVQLFNGAGDAWTTRHEQFGGDSGALPEAKRVSFEMRKLAPLFSPSEPPFIRQFGVEFWPLAPLEYSRDGKKWSKYQAVDIALPPATGELTAPDQQAALATLFGQDSSEDDGGASFGLLSQLFDMQTLTVTVYADGTLDWPESELPEAQAGALRQSILAATGAGQPELWAAHTAELLPEGHNTPPRAVRMQVMKALLDAAPDMLDQSYAPSAVTLDGETWHNLAPDFLLDDGPDDEGPDDDGPDHDSLDPDRPGGSRPEEKDDK
ncbi:hypothetical protein [Deinococcus sp.]|uniref:hypothetical protein n=1 Tax=Deinococcus sp. TaxID=47478 RepID=UPI0025C3C64D|nr:hypothetical protein [Deinococcus sp.]